MLTIRPLILSALLVVSTSLHLDRALADEPISHPFQLTDEKTFAPVSSTLDALVARKAKAETNHLCVIGQSLDDGSKQGWVYWREGKAIILWEPTTTGVRDLTLSRRYLRLDHDVVPSGDRRLASSSYLVSKEWAENLIAQCAIHGTEFLIEKHPATPHLNTENKKP